jgi:hypothetical protein
LRQQGDIRKVFEDGNLGSTTDEVRETVLSTSSTILRTGRRLTGRLKHAAKITLSLKTRDHGSILELSLDYIPCG